MQNQYVPSEGMINLAQEIETYRNNGLEKIAASLNQDDLKYLIEISIYRGNMTAFRLLIPKIVDYDLKDFVIDTSRDFNKSPAFLAALKSQ